MSVVPSTIDTLHQTAQTLLTVAEDALALTDGGIPDRSLVAPSAPVWDCCPFLAVHVAALTEEPTAPLSPIPATGQRTVFGSVILATYVVTAVRCAPPLDEVTLIPSVADSELVASQVHQDGWSLWNTLTCAILDGSIFGTCEPVHFDGGRSLNEAGMCVGWQFTIRAMIPGIPCEAAS